MAKTHKVTFKKSGITIDVAEDEYWTKDPVLSVFLEAVKVARPRAYGAHYLEISSAVQDAMQAAISGQMSVKDALDKAAGIITPLMPKASGIARLPATSDGRTMQHGASILHR